MDNGTLQKDEYGVSLMRINEHNRVFLKVILSSTCLWASFHPLFPL